MDKDTNMHGTNMVNDLEPCQQARRQMKTETTLNKFELTGLLYASLTAMSHDGVGTLNCSHVDTVSGAPNCCTSCHDDHDMGFDSLYEDADADDKIPVQHCLCCAKRNWLTGV